MIFIMSGGLEKESLPFQMNRRQPRPHGRSEFDITDFDITESYKTKVEIDIADSDKTEYDITRI